MPTAGSIYRHYKGTEYRVLYIARHSDTEEELVVYQDVAHPEKVWVRAVPVFMETVTIDGKEVPRFAFVR
ncbi:MAG TPA: DUF1653 domain-containing protein [Candidatus Paceibacterota bacterium]|nr:DUF1653 domain-containing protein [Candidatus Paceibacterota bacterium]